jgi:ribosomal protein S18 acetylase RimI-like enzyme
VPYRDITLHVSASNLAVLLYQRFGFKTEVFVAEYYRNYHPPETALSPHALFMRLRR